MHNIISYTFKIGTGQGQYPALSKITDSIFGFANILDIIVDNIPNISDFIQNKLLCFFRFKLFKYVN